MSARTTYMDVFLNREQSVAYQLYWCQVQQQILVSDAKRGFLYFYQAGQTWSLKSSVTMSLSNS